MKPDEGGVTHADEQRKCLLETTLLLAKRMGLLLKLQWPYTRTTVLGGKAASRGERLASSLKGALLYTNFYQVHFTMQRHPPPP